MRGAPAIAIVGTLSVALELSRSSFTSVEEMKAFVHSKYQHLLTARPTAVNIAESAKHFTQRLSDMDPSTDVLSARDGLVREMVGTLEADRAANRKMGRLGAEEIVRKSKREGGEGKKGVVVLTHCNTGSLATGGYGTALGMVRALHEMGALEHVYCTETRPYNQGARLTAYELVYEKIPATLICDSMGALLMRERSVDAVVVGADRIVSNGDVANKIGTYQLAIAARHHNIPFYVAAPVSTVDFDLREGAEIRIEERPGEEMLCVGGRRVATEGIGCWNPAFDVTPASLITGGIITERGVFAAKDLRFLLP